MRAILRVGAGAFLAFTISISVPAAFAEACPWPKQKGAPTCKAHRKSSVKRAKKKKALAQKASTEEITDSEPVHSSQASSVSFSGAETSQADAEAMKMGFFSQNRGMEYRPSVGMQWFSVQNNRPDSSLIRTQWLGVKAEMDTALVRFPVMELGAETAVFRTLTGLSPESRNTSVTDMSIAAYVLFKANTSKVGIPMVRVSTGYYGNWREGDPSVGFLPGASGFRVGAELSAIIDAMFAFGMSGNYVATHDGLFDLGAFLSQKFLSNARVGIWSARLGANVSLLLAEQRRESWIAVTTGVSAAF